MFLDHMFGSLFGAADHTAHAHHDTSFACVNVEHKSPGDGIHFPQPGDQVTMHYTGTLASNHKKFDSSLDRGTPFETEIGVGTLLHENFVLKLQNCQILVQNRKIL